MAQSHPLLRGDDRNAVSEGTQYPHGDRAIMNVRAEDPMRLVVGAVNDVIEIALLPIKKPLINLQLSPKLLPVPKQQQNRLNLLLLLSLLPHLKQRKIYPREPIKRKLLGQEV